jgi:hypothetical protein
MSETKKELSMQELLAANPSTLSNEEITRRINFINLRKAEREVEVIEAQNEEFQQTKEEKQRIAEVNRITQEEENARLSAERDGCFHKSGGKGRAGFFKGDGRWGYTVATQILPTSEVYYLCFRCQKEWHMPKKRDVITGKITLSQYYAQLKEYNDVATWPKPLYDTENGDIPGATRFTIPKLELQRAKDDADFEAFLAKQASRSRDLVGV